MRGYQARRWGRRLLVGIVIVGVAIVAVGQVDAQRADPAKLSQQQLHRWATEGSSKDFDAVKVHRVTIASAEVDARELVEEYVARVLSRNPEAAEQGRFNPATGEIRITGDESRFDASLPGKLHPVFYHTLRHEYGHAALTDWLKARGVSVAGQTPIHFAERSQTVPKRVPRDLRPVITEWRTQPQTVYGPPYLSATLTEYLAESYARYMEGRSVGPVTTAFMEAQYASRQ